MSPLLEVSGISKSFGAVRSLSEVTLDIPHGGVVGLIGPNGAGKSTLVNVISGVYPPNEGVLRFDGTQLQRASTAKRARMGLVRTFQRPAPMHSLTCSEAVMIGGLTRGLSMRSAKVEAQRVMALLGLGDVGGRPARTLTTGQLKLIDLARVLMLTPKLVLLDELMSGLSRQESETAQRAVEHLTADGTTFLVIEHLMDVVRRLSHRLAVLDAGRLVAQGEFDVVMRDPRVVEAYLGHEGLNSDDA